MHDSGTSRWDWGPLSGGKQVEANELKTESETDRHVGKAAKQAGDVARRGRRGLSKTVNTAPSGNPLQETGH